MYMFTARNKDYSHLQIAKYYRSMLKKYLNKTLVRFDDVCFNEIFKISLKLKKSHCFWANEIFISLPWAARVIPGSLETVTFSAPILLATSLCFGLWSGWTQFVMALSSANSVDDELLNGSSAISDFLLLNSMYLSWSRSCLLADFRTNTWTVLTPATVFVRQTDDKWPTLLQLKHVLSIALHDFTCPRPNLSPHR